MSRYNRTPSTVVVTPVDLSDAEANALEYLRAHAQTNRDLGQEVEMPSAVRVGWQWAIVDTPSGLYALCTEGVGPSGPITDDDPLTVEFWIDGYENDERGRKTFSMFSACSSTLTPEMLRERATGEPVKLEDWIRSFGARLEANYDGWRRLLEQALAIPTA